MSGWRSLADKLDRALATDDPSIFYCKADYDAWHEYREYIARYFVWACRDGCINLAQYLYSKCVFTVFGEAFDGACAYGHTQIAEWLYNTFGVTTKDVRDNNNAILRWSCSGGNLQII